MRKSYLATTAIGLVFLISLSTNSSLFAQREGNRYLRDIYLGVGLGVNDYGLGLGVEYPISNKVSLFVNAGLGGWGYKFGGGFNYYINQAPFGSSFSLGYSSASGLDNFETEMTVEPNGESATVDMSLNRVGTINLIYSYGWQVGRFHKFIFSAGYAIPVTSDPYTVDAVYELDEVSETVMDIMQPGGLIIGIRIMFGT